VTSRVVLSRLLQGALILVASADLGHAALVEFSMDKEPTWGVSVGTCEYTPTKTEELFFGRLSEERQSTIEIPPGEWNDKGEKFSLHGHEGEFVSWFGIVQQITRMGWPRLGDCLSRIRISRDCLTAIPRLWRSMAPVTLPLNSRICPMT
jgi:hypothetical protein